MTSESVILKKEATLLLLLTKCLMIFSDLVRLKDVESWCCFFGNRLKISLFLVVVVGGIYTMTYPVFIYQKWGMQGKVRIIIIFSCGFSSGESNTESSWTSWLKCSCTGVDNNLFIDSPISYCHALKTTNGGCPSKTK